MMRESRKQEQRSDSVREKRALLFCVYALMRLRIQAYVACPRAAVSAIMALITAFSIIVLMGASDALRWSVAYGQLSATAQSACDRLAFTSRNHVHTFQDSDRLLLAESAFDLEAFIRYPEAKRSISYQRVNEIYVVGGINQAKVDVVFDMPTYVLRLFGILSLPLTLSATCSGIPPAPEPGDYLVNNDFGSFDPSVHNFLRRSGTVVSGVAQSYQVDEIQQFGWFATENTTDNCGLEFMPTWNLPSIGSFPPLSGHSWAVSLRGCDRDWAARPLELHPGFYEIYVEFIPSSTSDQQNLMSLWVNTIYNETSQDFLTQDDWRWVARFGGGVATQGQTPAWQIGRGVIEVNHYEPVMLLLWPEAGAGNAETDEGLTFAHFKIRYLGSDFNPNDEKLSINQGRDFLEEVN